MSEREQFEADYRAAFPGMGPFLLKFDDGDYVCRDIRDAYAIWLQQAKRHEAEKAELRDIVDSVADHFQIGANARTKSVILANIGNATRRAKCLSEIENRFFSETKIDDDGEEYQSTNLSWGDLPEEYAEQFAAELRAKESAAGVVAYGQSCCGNPEDCPNEYTKDCIPVTAPPAQAVSVPSGWKLVPIEPTHDMICELANRCFPSDWDAGKELQRKKGFVGDSSNMQMWVPPNCECEMAVGAYSRMLAAAPSPEQVEKPAGAGESES